MDLSELISEHRGARSYADLARDCGGSPTDKRLQQLVRDPIKNFPDPGTLAALARGLRVSQSVVVLATAESLGLDVRTSAPRLVELLPVGAADLTEQQAAAIAHLIRTFVDAGSSAREVEVHPGVLDDEYDGPVPSIAEINEARGAAADSEPTVAGVLDAKRKKREAMQQPQKKAARPDPKKPS